MIYIKFMFILLLLPFKKIHTLHHLSQARSKTKTPNSNKTNKPVATEDWLLAVRSRVWWRVGEEG